MKMTSNDRKLHIALTMMQVMCFIVLGIGSWFAAVLTVFGGTAVIVGLMDPSAHELILGGLFGLATVAVTAACSVSAIISYIRMARRLKQERAFTEQNGRTLAAISKRCFICAGTLIAGYMATMLSVSLFNYAPKDYLEMLAYLGGTSIPIDVLAFMYLGVGLVSRALYGLLHRAKALQDENDLTV